MSRYIDADALQELLKKQIKQYEEMSDKTYHADAYYDTDKKYGRHRDYGHRADGVEKAIEILQQMPAAEVVNKELFDQVRWERDEAIKTLEAHGLGNMER